MAELRRRWWSWYDNMTIWWSSCDNMMFSWGAVRSTQAFMGRQWLNWGGGGVNLSFWWWDLFPFHEISFHSSYQWWDILSFHLWRDSLYHSITALHHHINALHISAPMHCTAHQYTTWDLLLFREISYCLSYLWWDLLSFHWWRDSLYNSFAALHYHINALDISLPMHCTAHQCTA